MKYLQEYFIRNDGEIAALCANSKPEKDKEYFCLNDADLARLHSLRKRNRDEGKPSCDVINNKYDINGQFIASDYVLDAAASLCIETETIYCGAYHPQLTDEEINLSDQIKKHANHVICSVDKYPPTAAAALVCIGMENTLLLELLQSRFAPTLLITLSKKIRQIASTLILYKGPETAVVAAAAGAMVGLAKEAKFLHYVMTQKDGYMLVDYNFCHQIRLGTTEALKRLQESICETYGNGDVASATKTDKPQGTVGDLKCKDLDSMEQPKGDLHACYEMDMDAKLGLTINKDDEIEGQYSEAYDILKCSTGLCCNRRMTC